jgi:broad specificity phosphatase PhoE
MSQLFSVTFYDPPKLSSDESMFHIARRMRRFVDWVLKRHCGETVAAVSHGDALAIYLMALRGAELSEKQLRRSRTDYPDRASVNRLEFDESGALISRTYTRPK